MGFFDSGFDPQIADAIAANSSEYEADRYRRGYIGTHNWGGPNNLSSEIYSVMGDDTGNDMVGRLLETWAGTNDPNYTARMTAGNSYVPGGDGSVPQEVIDQYRKARLDYIKEKFGEGDYAFGRTKIGGSDSDGAQYRFDLMRRNGDGWTPIDGAALAGTSTGYKSDGIKIGSIIGSFLTAGALNGWAEGAGAAAGAGAGSSSAGVDSLAGYYGGVGGVDGSLVGSGVVNNTGAAAGAAGSGGANSLANYYSGVGGVDGSLVGSGVVNNTGAAAGAAGAGGAAEAAGTTSTAAPQSTYDPSSFNPNAYPDGVPGMSDFAGTTGTTSASGWGQYIPAVTQALNALIASRQSDRARDALVAGGNQANETQRYMFDTLNALQAPYRTTAYAGLDRINGLMRDPSSVAMDPGYEWQRQQGQQGIERSAAARGLGLSGAALKEASRYNTNFATTKYNDVWNRNLAAAGLGQVSNAQTNQFGTNYANNVGNTQMGMGNALAANYLNQGNIYSDALNGIGAYYSPRRG